MTRVTGRSVNRKTVVPPRRHGRVKPRVNAGRTAGPSLATCLSRERQPQWIRECSNSHCDNDMSELYQGDSPNARLLAGTVASSAKGGTRLGNAFSVSAATHLILAALVIFVFTLPIVPAPGSNEPISLK